MTKILKHQIDKKSAELIDRLRDDLSDDTLMTTLETARWLNVSTQFLEIGRTQGYGPPATMLAPKVIRYRKNSTLKWLIERERAYTKRAKAGKTLALWLAPLVLLAMLSTNAMADLSEAQKENLKTYATVHLLADECHYKENISGFIVKAIEAGLTPEDMNSVEARNFIRIAVLMFRSEHLASKTDPAKICADAWGDFGAAGKVHPDLLMKR